MPAWPGTGFASIEAARPWCRGVRRGSRHPAPPRPAMRFPTQNAYHRGGDADLLANRHAAHEAARDEHLARSSVRTRNLQPLGTIDATPSDRYPGARAMGPPTRSPMKPAAAPWPAKKTKEHEPNSSDSHIDTRPTHVTSMNKRSTLFTDHAGRAPCTERIE